eukprot:CAMPEP_0173228148 /NCGR_PEP_ID=MMETSP1142-20121109/6360_1 /TAXON_ID=483371 /ORGANISM="non described non described, Strain CCMP2298" /LENGTH=228 /DNA_ID=CAMNT_0014156747 /DNA_START=162 /DNA_END=849 /DNA_ORIENTATION=-
MSSAPASLPSAAPESLFSLLPPLDSCLRQQRDYPVPVLLQEHRVQIVVARVDHQLQHTPGQSMSCGAGCGDATHAAAQVHLQEPGIETRTGTRLPFTPAITPTLPLPLPSFSTLSAPASCAASWSLCACSPSQKARSLPYALPRTFSTLVCLPVAPPAKANTESPPLAPAPNNPFACLRKCHQQVHVPALQQHVALHARLHPLVAAGYHSSGLQLHVDCQLRHLVLAL